MRQSLEAGRGDGDLGRDGRSGQVFCPPWAAVGESLNSWSGLDVSYRLSLFRLVNFSLPFLLFAVIPNGVQKSGRRGLSSSALLSCTLDAVPPHRTRTLDTAGHEKHHVRNTLCVCAGTTIAAIFMFGEQI